MNWLAAGSDHYVHNLIHGAEHLRFPIKLNENILPAWLRKLCPSRGDPRKLLGPDPQMESFESCITAFKVGDTWKSTRKSRQPLTDELILGIAACWEKPVILEIGASAGSTSLELIEKLDGDYGRYYLTDTCFCLDYMTRGPTAYFYHPVTLNCILRATGYLIVYEDVKDAVYPLGSLARRLIGHAPPYDPATANKLSLLHPEVRRLGDRESRVVVCEHNVFDPWPRETVDIVKVANLLNRTYFSDDKMLVALANLKNAMRVGGRLVITDNRNVEQVSSFRKGESGFVLEREVNGGTDIVDLLASA